MNDKKIELPWSRAMGFPKDYSLTGNGRVDDDFRVTGVFVPKDQAIALHQGAKIILEYQEQLRLRYQGIIILKRPEPVDYAIELLRQGIQK